LEYAICTDKDGILPSGGAKMDFTGTAIGEVGGKNFEFKYFDLSYAYEYQPEGQKEPTKKFVSIPVAIQVQGEVKGKPNSKISQVADECDRLSIQFGLHTHEYVILAKVGENAVLKSALMKENDKDPLN
jgi:hypothetical protein